MLKKILLKFDGLNYRQEYLCIGKQSFLHPLHVYLLSNGKPVKDITNEHCFIGYAPLVFAVDQEFLHTTDEPELIFSQEKLPLGSSLPPSTALAYLRLIKTGSYGSISFFEGRKARHHFINRFHQQIGSVINYFFNRKPGNVYLDNELYKQVQVAYSVPRKISLITVGNGELFNLFPTDLHGQTCDNLYIISLRHEGLACKEVMDSRKILLNEMPADAYKMVYSLGKNHMQPLKPADNFPFSSILSANFRLPVATGALSYRELELKHSFIHGIHRIMVFSIIHQEVVEEVSSSLPGSQKESLVHIHNVYATWRDKNGFQSNFLLR